MGNQNMQFFFKTVFFIFLLKFRDVLGCMAIKSQFFSTLEYIENKPNLIALVRQCRSQTQK